MTPPLPESNKELERKKITRIVSTLQLKSLKGWKSSIDSIDEEYCEQAIDDTMAVLAAHDTALRDKVLAVIGPNKVHTHGGIGVVNPPDCYCDEHPVNKFIDKLRADVMRIWGDGK